MFATSIPSNVEAADVNDLKPSIGRVRLLMKRWSCSTMLFKYFPLTISIGKPLDWEGLVTEVLSVLYFRFGMVPPSAALTEVADGSVYGV